MPRWTFEPGHTAAVFKARHMMATWVRGHFVNIHGTLTIDAEALVERDGGSVKEDELSAERCSAWEPMAGDR